jgi:transcriptional regulator with XRE-family HTH domain
MVRNTTVRGRPRTSDEQLFTAALMEHLDRERERRSMDQRSFAKFLGLHESLLSLYRSGNRHPSQLGMIDMDRKLPGLWARVVQSYYRLLRRRDEEERPEVDDESIVNEVGTHTALADRVGVHHMEEISYR